MSCRGGFFAAAALLLLLALLAIDRPVMVVSATSFFPYLRNHNNPLRVRAHLAAYLRSNLPERSARNGLAGADEAGPVVTTERSPGFIAATEGDRGGDRESGQTPSGDGLRFLDGGEKRASMEITTPSAAADSINGPLGRAYS